MWMGWDEMGGRSRPIPPGRCPYLNCRRDTGLSHSPLQTECPSIHPDGYRKEGTWAGKLGQEAQSAQAKQAQGLLVSASGMGVCRPSAGRGRG